MPDEQAELALAYPCEQCGDREESCDDCHRCDDCECECTRCGSCNGKTDSFCDCCENGECCCNCATCHYGIRSHRVESICSNCNLCERHCECQYCNGCDSRVESYCHSCEHCDLCCNCSNGESPRYDGTFRYIGSPSKAVPRYVSLELEYAGCDATSVVENACANWEDYCVEDGSLPDEGFEINTNPTRGEEYFKHIGNICEDMRKAEAKINNQCGLHVHVDARDLNWHDIYKLALLYQRVEDALFKMQPKSRQDNHYCLRVDNNYNLSAKDYKHKLLRKLYEHEFPKHRKETRPATCHRSGKRVFGERTEKYHSARYYAMNIHTFFYRGTIEFRHAASTSNTDKATNWGLVCMWIVEQAVKMSVAQINALPENATQALCQIVPNDIARFIVARQLEQKERNY